MPQFRFPKAARFLGVSDDTVRRRADAGLLAAGVDAVGRTAVDGAGPARLAEAVRKVGLAPGPLAVAVVRSTHVVVEIPVVVHAVVPETPGGRS